MQLLASRMRPTACFYAWTPNLSCQLGCWQWVDDVLSLASRARSPFLHSLCSSVSVCSSLLLQHFQFSSKIKSVIAGAKWYATKWSRALWLPSKFCSLLVLPPACWSQGKAHLLWCGLQPCWLVCQLHIELESDCFSNSLHRHNSVATLLVV